MHTASGIDPGSWTNATLVPIHSMQEPKRGSRQRLGVGYAASLRAYKSEKWHSHGNSHRERMGRNRSLGQ